MDKLDFPLPGIGENHSQRWQPALTVSNVRARKKKGSSSTILGPCFDGCDTPPRQKVDRQSFPISMDARSPLFFLILPKKALGVAGFRGIEYSVMLQSNYPVSRLQFIKRPSWFPRPCPRTRGRLRGIDAIKPTAWDNQGKALQGGSWWAMSRTETRLVRLRG